MHTAAESDESREIEGIDSVLDGRDGGRGVTSPSAVVAVDEGPTTNSGRSSESK